jgi:glycerate kinase
LYGPQKGASSAQVSLLSRRLERLAQQYESRTGVDVTELEGAGAAGGLAGGLAAIGARLAPGFDVIAEALDFGVALEHADLVVTGEGRLDTTSLEGKVVGGVVDWADEYAVPAVSVIVGQATEDARAQLLEQPHVRQVLTLVDRAYQPEESYARAALLLEEAALEAGQVALTG